MFGKNKKLLVLFLGAWVFAGFFAVLYFYFAEPVFSLDNPLTSLSMFGVDLSISPDDDSFYGVSDKEKIVRTIAGVGIKWTRETFMQSGIEYPKGTYHWTEYDNIVGLWCKYNINMIGQLQGGSNYSGHGRVNGRGIGYTLTPGRNTNSVNEWAQFVGLLVERYDGDNDYGGQPAPNIPSDCKIKYWEGMNEPNYGESFWYRQWQKGSDPVYSPDLNHLIDIQKAFYGAVKNVDFSAKVIAPSVTGAGNNYGVNYAKIYFCDRKTDTLPYYDIANVHVNMNGANILQQITWRSPRWKGWDSYFYTDYYNGDYCLANKKIWMTESGFYRGGETTRMHLILYIKFFIEGGYLASTNSNLFRIYTYPQAAGNDSYNFYFDTITLQLRELGRFMENTHKILGEAVGISKSATQYSEQYEWFKFNRDGKIIYVAWARENKNAFSIAQAANASATITLDINSNNVKKTTIDGAESFLSVPNNGKLTLTVGTEPIFIEESSEGYSAQNCRYLAGSSADCCDPGEICEGTVYHNASDCGICCSSECVLPETDPCVDGVCKINEDCLCADPLYGDCSNIQCVDPCNDNVCSMSYDCNNCSDYGDCRASDCQTSDICSDSDNGINLEKKGVCSGPTGNATDYCTDADLKPVAESSVLREFYCQNNICQVTGRLCGEGRYCKDGRCLALTEEQEVEEEENCNDSDSGSNLQVFGLCQDATGQVEDYCVDNSGKKVSQSEIIREFYCRKETDKCDVSTLRCPTGAICLNGECLAQGQKNPDINQDGKIDVKDFGILLSNWGESKNHPGDLDSSGKVNSEDIKILFQTW